MSPRMIGARANSNPLSGVQLVYRDIHVAKGALDPNGRYERETRGAPHQAQRPPETQDVIPDVIWQT